LYTDDAILLAVDLSMCAEILSGPEDLDVPRDVKRHFSSAEELLIRSYTLSRSGETPARTKGWYVPVKAGSKIFTDHVSFLFITASCNIIQNCLASWGLMRLK